MTELHPNILLEITRAVVSIAGWWVLFYKLHCPPTKLRRIILLASFVLCYTFWMLIPLSDTNNVILWAVIIIFFALLTGDIRNSLFTALYYIGIEATIDTIRSFVIRYIFGGSFRGYSREYYIQFNLQYLFVLLWTLFYYWIMKKHVKKVPLRFWVMALVPPFGTSILLTRYADIARPLLTVGINIYLEGILFGLFLFALNLLTFYMYVNLSIAYHARVFASEVLQTPPLYTPETGLSEAFIHKYEISPREREVIEALIEGKANKEIAEVLFISVKTVEFHLRNVYQKTGTPNRFALYSLIRS
jgi:DNA-binding CsgD family transcriptional regulator